MAMHSSGFGSVNFGVFELLEIDGLQERRDGQVVLSGQESSPPATLAEVELQHEQILALQTGRVYAVTFTDKATRNGYFLVEDMESTLTDHQGEVAICDWTITMMRMGSHKEVDIQSRLTPTVRNNDFELTGERVHAPAQDHYAYFTGSDTPSILTRTGVDGDIRVYRSLAANLAPKWGCEPEDYWGGAVKIGPTTAGDAYNGLKHELGNFWNLHNSLINMGPSPTAGTFFVYYYGSGGYQENLWVFDVNGTTPSWDSATIIKNDPEYSVVRLTASRNPGRVILDLGLRRGARAIELYMQSGSSASLSFHNAITVANTDTSASGYIEASANDAYGNRFACGSARTFSAHANGGVTKTATTSLDGFLGYVYGGDSAVDGDTAPDLLNQYIASMAEATYAVDR